MNKINNVMKNDHIRTTDMRIINNVNNNVKVMEQDNDNTNTKATESIKSINPERKRMKTRLTNQGYHIDVTTIARPTICKIEKDLTMIPYRLDATKEELEKDKFT